jgi:hypothetical protein
MTVDTLLLTGVFGSDLQQLIIIYPSLEMFMNSKQRCHAALTGQTTDRPPVTVLYNMLYYEDHYSELTGLPAWELVHWLNSDPDEYFRLFKIMHDQAPFEMLQPHMAPPLLERQSSEFISQNGRLVRRNRITGAIEDLQSISGHAKDYAANEIQKIFSHRDISRIIDVPDPQELVAEGSNAYLDKIVENMGADHYIISGGVVGTIYSCGWYLGQQNTLAMLLDQPDLVEAVCERITEQNFAVISQLAMAGGDAIYIDDATATNDMISPKHYERFSLPYMTRMVSEIHRLGHQAILIYFGGVMDRLEAIASTGADGLLIETTMKSYTNDIVEAVRRVGNSITLFANIDPVGILQNASENELEAEIQRQFSAGCAGRGFIVSTASPITPGTSLSRVQKFLELGKNLSYNEG